MMIQFCTIFHLSLRPHLSFKKSKSQKKNDNVIELNEVVTEQNKESHPNDQFKGFIASINNLKSLLNETLLSLNTPKKDKEWKEIGFKLLNLILLQSVVINISACNILLETSGLLTFCYNWYFLDLHKVEIKT